MAMYKTRERKSRMKYAGLCLSICPRFHGEKEHRSETQREHGMEKDQGSLIHLDPFYNPKGKDNAQETFQECDEIEVLMQIGIVKPRIAVFNNIKLWRAHERCIDAQPSFNHGQAIVQGEAHRNDQEGGEKDKKPSVCIPVKTAGRCPVKNGNREKSQQKNPADIEDDIDRRIDILEVEHGQAENGSHKKRYEY